MESQNSRIERPVLIFWRRFKRNKTALAGCAIVFLVFLTALSAPVLSPYNPADIDVEKILSGPSQSHLLGTDDLGRDVLSRMIWGARISLLVGFVAVGISILIGIGLGAVAGYYGYIVDDVLMRFVDVMLAIP